MVVDRILRSRAALLLIRVARLGSVLLVPIQIRERFWVVGDHGVEVQRLRVGEVGVGHRGGDVGPVGAQPASEAPGVVAGAEVVILGFGVALLALELVIVRGRAGIGVGALGSERSEVGVVADRSGAGGDDARAAEERRTLYPSGWEVMDGPRLAQQKGESGPPDRLGGMLNYYHRAA